MHLQCSGTHVTKIAEIISEVEVHTPSEVTDQSKSEMCHKRRINMVWGLLFWNSIRLQGLTPVTMGGNWFHIFKKKVFYTFSTFCSWPYKYVQLHAVCTVLLPHNRAPWTLTLLLLYRPCKGSWVRIARTACFRTAFSLLPSSCI